MRILSQQKSDKCPYIRNKDCGHPLKEKCINADYESCFSFRCLKDCEENMEVKKDGKQDA